MGKNKSIFFSICVLLALISSIPKPSHASSVPFPKSYYHNNNYEKKSYLYRYGRQLNLRTKVSKRMTSEDYIKYYSNLWKLWRPDHSNVSPRHIQMPHKTSKDKTAGGNKRIPGQRLSRKKNRRFFYRFKRFKPKGPKPPPVRKGKKFP